MTCWNPTGKGPTSTTTLSPEEIAARKACPTVSLGMFFFFEGEDLYIGSDMKKKKVQNDVTSLPPGDVVGRVE